jgi:hypothetical protein
MDVCQQQCPGCLHHYLPECGAVNVEELADAALGVSDFAPNLISREVNKARRQLGKQRLKLQPFLQTCL